MKLHRFIFFTLILFGWNLLAQPNSSQMENFAIVMHGGAGTILKKDMPPELEKQYSDKMKEALQVGYDTLKKGGTALSAVEASIKILEDSPLYNAGKGSAFTSDGKNEMDASVMDGKSLKAGAVAGVRTIKNPVSAARMVMEKTPHVLIAGKGAEKLAKENGLKIVDTSYFFVQRRWDQMQRAKKEEKIKLDHSSDTSGSIQPLNDMFNDKKFGTVGAVALDKFGNLAAGTSTGGMTNKKPGRVGDSPIIGAGTYANNATCAISCTGHGEYFIRYAVAHDVSALMEYKALTLEQAANEVVMKKLVEAGGEGGLIGIDAKGNIAMPFNSKGMYRGFVKKGGKISVMIYKDDLPE
ncbi:MAG: isoaspartyl peptidase/L-asparaginase [Bacteroidetes bacterium]|nr:isoaspartyl peptidase/L-asparaginase [Bacteroidota bacterium]